ncbi:MAG: hypothetical protein QF926_14850 [Alphaproteobacteria bacterium]|jgi:hypothetical protein|nr:hypothetical protein [Alphaproteobacteria bacterium]
MAGVSATTLSLGRLLVPIVAAAVVVVFAGYTYQADLRLVDTSFVTGYVLLVMMIGLFLLRWRKRLSMVPLGRAAIWLAVHLIGGVLAVAAFWIHTGSLWPISVFEQLIALLFYFVSLSGIFGYVIQRVYPRRLTQTGREIIYERIPAAVGELRAVAESLVLECAEKTDSDTLCRYYLETFDWYFRAPRFFFSHATGGARGEFWARHHCGTVRRYLSTGELPYLEKLTELLDAKNVVDVHYAGQRMMKVWLWFHVPTAIGLLILSLWHFLVMNVYGS